MDGLSWKILLKWMIWGLQFGGMPSKLSIPLLTAVFIAFLPGVNGLPPGFCPTDGSSPNGDRGPTLLWLKLVGRGGWMWVPSQQSDVIPKKIEQ